MQTNHKHNLRREIERGICGSTITEDELNFLIEPLLMRLEGQPIIKGEEWARSTPDYRKHVALPKYAKEQDGLKN